MTKESHTQEYCIRARKTTRHLIASHQLLLAEIFLISQVH